VPAEVGELFKLPPADDRIESASELSAVIFRCHPPRDAQDLSVGSNVQIVLTRIAHGSDDRKIPPKEGMEFVKNRNRALVAGIINGSRASVGVTPGTRSPN